MASEKSQEHKQRAQEYLEEYKYSWAIKELKAALELEFEDAELESLLARAEQAQSDLNAYKQTIQDLRQERRFEEAEEEIQKALKLNPLDDELKQSQKELNALIQGQHLRVAQTLREEFRLEEAIEEFEIVLGRNPRNANAQHGLREAQKTKELLDSHLEKAEQSYDQEEYETAITGYEQILEINPSHTDSLQRIEKCREILEEIDALQDTIRQSLESQAFSRAIESLERLRSLKALSSEMELLLGVTRHNERAAALKDQGRLEESEAEILRAIELDPDDSRLLETRKEIDLLIQHKHLQSAADLRKEYKYEKAIDEYQNVLKRNPGDEKTKNILTETERIVGEIEDCLLRAGEYQENRKYQEAASEYERVTELNPAHPFAHEKMRECIDALAVIECANEELNEALSVKDFQKAIDSLEKLSELAEDTKPAKKQIVELKDARDRIESLLAMGEALLKDKKYHKAITELQKIFAIDDRHKGAISLIKEAEHAIEENNRKRKRRLAFAAAAVSIAIALITSYVLWSNSQYEAHMAKAREAFASEDWIEASDCCKQALSYKPRDEEGLALLAEISDGLQASAEETRKEMLVAKENAIESMAEVYASELLEQAAKTETQSDALLKSLEYAMALKGHRKAIHEYNNARQESLASMVRSQKEADRARSELEGIKSGLDINEAQRYAEKTYDEARQAESQAGGHYKKRMYVPARVAYVNAKNDYEKIKDIIKKEEEARKKTLESKKEMVAAKKGAIVSMAEMYAKGPLEQAAKTETQSELLLKSQKYTLALDSYRKAIREYNNARQESLASMTKSQKEADRARSEMERAKAGLDENEAQRYAGKTYNQARKEMQHGNEVYEKANYAVAKGYYKKATGLFMESSKIVKQNLRYGTESASYQRLFSESERKNFSKRRNSMIYDLRNKKSFKNERILSAMNKVPMELFCPKDRRDKLYSDAPIPIGYEESISQPYITALMLDKLELELGDRVLELKTASGYQAALLYELGTEVYTVESDKSLSRLTKERLKNGNYLQAMHFGVGDVNTTWHSEGPFDAIIATAAFKEIPKSIERLLEIGGKFIVPAGKPKEQWLVLIERTSNDNFNQKRIMKVNFSMMPGEL